jgi:hypothetical protein
VDGIRWNPHDDNELVACSERHNSVHIYDLSHAGGIDVTSPTRILHASITHGIHDIVYRPGRIYTQIIAIITCLV